MTPESRPDDSSPTAKTSREGKKEKAGWREAFVLKHEHPVNIVACSADWIAAGDEGGNLFLYDAKTGKKGTLQMKGGKEKGLHHLRRSTAVHARREAPVRGAERTSGHVRFNLDPKADQPSSWPDGRGSNLPRNVGRRRVLARITEREQEIWPCARTPGRPATRGTMNRSCM